MLYKTVDGSAVQKLSTPQDGVKVEADSKLLWVIGEVGGHNLNL